MKKITVGDNDMFFSYKVQHFTGFAPCFQDSLFSLACCKGGAKGMRVQICKKVKKGIPVWIIGIAGSDIRKEGFNCSGIGYAHGDVLFVAKVTEVMTWKEYSEKYMGKRIDAIYALKNEQIVCVDCSNHRGREYLMSDCSLSENGDEKSIFCDVKQIVLSNEFYVFNKDHPIGDVLNVGRNYSCWNNGLEERIKALRNLLEHCGDFASDYSKGFYKMNNACGSKNGCTKQKKTKC